MYLSEVQIFWTAIEQEMLGCMLYLLFVGQETAVEPNIAFIDE